MSVINTNTKSLVAQNALTVNNRAMSKTMEQLSTGKRINAAKDDAAGLAISSKMTSQVKGLNQAVRNANDAISMIQVAEGSLVEVTNMMQRMRELAVQSANDTNTSGDRSAMNLEFSALKEEINRIGGNTQWNNMNVMDKSFNANGDAGKFKFQVGANQAQTIDLTIGDYRTTTNAPAAGGAATAGVTKVGSTEVTAQTAAAAVARVESLAVNSVPDAGDVITIELGDETPLSYTVVAGDLTAGDDDASKAAIATKIAALTMPTGYAAAVDGTDANKVNFTRASGADFALTGGVDGTGFASAVKTAGSEEVVARTAAAAVPREVSISFSGTYAENDEIEISLGDQKITYTVDADDIGDDDAATLEAITAKIADLTMPTGFAAEVDAVDATKINFTRASGETFAASAAFSSEAVAGDLSMINDSNISTQEDSNDAIINLDAALKTVNEGRAEMGATINRLTYAADNLTNVAQNTSESRSRILDTDYAQATTELARTQIISQAATAMLAQANQAPQSVLSLLR